MLRAVALAVLCAGPAQAQPAEALVRFARGDYTGAIAAADGSPASALLVGQSYAALGDAAAALDALGRADTTDARVLSATAAALDALGRDAEAHRVLLRAAAADSTDAGLAAALGASHARRREWDAAVLFYQTSLRVRPSAATSEALGDVLTQAGRPGAAVEALQQAVAQDSLRVSAVVKLADAMTAAGQVGRGMFVLSRALERTPTSVALLRARTAETLGASPLAADDYGAALALSDSALVDRQGLGRALVRMNQFRAAVPVLDAAFRLDPADASTAYYRALALRDSGREAESLAAFDTAAVLAGRGTFVQLLWHTARARLAVNDAEGAVRDLGLAIALEPPTPLLLLDLAVATEKTGDLPRATERYADFLAAASDIDATTRAFAEERVQALRARPARRP